MRYKPLLLVGSIAFAVIILLNACQKGELLHFQQYVKLNVEAYYEDTSLFTTASFNDSVILQDPSSKDGGQVTSLFVNPVELPLPVGDSGRLKITVVKKRNSNIEFDSIIHLTNLNEYLLIQLDPSQRPYLLNKRTAAATLARPHEDSIKVRFYFTSNDPNFRNKNFSPPRTISKVDLELWALKEVNGEMKPVNLNRKIRVNANQLTDEYFSFKKGELYAWRILDVSPGVASNQRVVEAFEYDADFTAFTRGFIELSDQTVFQTVKITQTYDNIYFQPGLNGRYLFGF
jgi:hypothetical protein